MTNFPNSFDDDSTLPPINDNITQEGGAAINALRDVAFSMENYLGLGAAGSTGSIAARFGVSINPDGTIKTSAIASMGLVTLPIINSQISNNAMIDESKLLLDYRTLDLFNYIRDLSKDVNLVDGWIATTGIKLEPHLIGAIYRHVLNQIDVTNDLINYPYLLNEFRTDRNNLQAYNLINDINNELLDHEWADGYPAGTVQNIVTTSGYTYPSNYAHYAGGIFINTSQFVVIPQTNQDLQSLANYIDSSSILLLGTRIQNLYANGISRNSRSSSLTADGYGQLIVPVTPATAFLNYGNSTTPVDNISNGDDIIQFMPTDGYIFASQFASVRVGDICTINYGTIEVQYRILEKKYQQDNFGNQIFIIRIPSKNLLDTTHATAEITRPLFNNNKYGVLATSVVNGIPSMSTPLFSSLIVATARGAQALGIDFSSDELNETHCFLYLAIYPNGNPADGYTILPGIDVTGNGGITPGSYTIDSVVAATNSQLRQPGWNSRFIAFQENGNFGIMLADSYNNVSFSILSGVVNGTGAYDQGATQSAFPFNVVDLFPTVGVIGPDPLGLGPFGANIASPPYQSSYSSAGQALSPTQLFVPLKRNNYYVNGVERERMTTDVGQVLDQYGDGYWPATILTAPVIIPGPSGRVITTYTIDQDLTASQLKIGKTIVVQSIGHGGTFVDFGRFIISDLSLPCDNISGVTTITVYDAVNSLGYSPTLVGGTAGIGTQVGIYFNSDSVSFNAESATDFSSVTPFKRHFEVYVDDEGVTYTHERGRMFIGTGSGSPPSVPIDGGISLYSSTSIAYFDFVGISPKLRGYQVGPINKISLFLNHYNAGSGAYDGYLGFYNGATIVNIGPHATGKRGEITRFYDQTCIDFIDINLDIGISNNIIPNFSNHIMDIQLFPTLALDEEIMLISTCQLNDQTFLVNQLVDQRQFGNISEEELTNSALNYISLPDRLLHFNGVIRGFDIINITNEFVNIDGGMALVNGNLQAVNSQIITFPKIQELYESTLYPINFALCVNSSGELVTIPLTDYDSFFPTPNAPNRLMVVTNLVSSTIYNSDSNIFSYILNNLKNLTVLYIVSSVVTGTGPSATVSLSGLGISSPRDVRRFINDSDSNLPAVITDSTFGNSQGNFQSLTTALNWIKFNSNCQSVLQIKGTHSVSNDLGFNFTLDIYGIGSDNPTMNFTTLVLLNNVTFNNLTVNFSGNVSMIDVTFNNCTINLGGEVIGNGITINDSQLNTGDTGYFGKVPRLSINNSTVTVTNISCNAFILANITSFQNTTFNYSSNASGRSNYTSSDLVNSASAMIYRQINSGESLVNININGCTFFSQYTDHFSFFCVIFNDPFAFAAQMDISNNKFISQTTEDIRSVICFGSITTGGRQYPFFPVMTDIVIDNNVCNQDQMIIIATKPDGAHSLVSPNNGVIITTNCRISNNVCGTIGYLTAIGNVADYSNSPSNTEVINIQDKVDHLIISGNTCHLITNLTITGTYQPFYYQNASNVATIGVEAGTGQTDIINNSCNWIAVGAYSYAGTSGYTGILGQGVLISDNRLNPFSSSYLSSYTNFIASSSGISIPNYGIYLSADYSLVGNSQSIISRNNLAQPLLYLNNASQTEILGTTYDTGIYVSNNAIVSDNVVFGAASRNMIALGGVNNITITCTGNQLNRLGITINAYISGLNVSTGNLFVTGNRFDSIYCDHANTIFNDLNSGFNNGTDYFGNYNQISYTSVPLYNYSQDNFINSSGDGQSITTNQQYDGSAQTSPGLGSNIGFFANPSTIQFNLSVPLKDVLPAGVTLLYAALGLWNNTENGHIGNIVPGASTSKIFFGLDVNMYNNIAPPLSPSSPVTGGSLLNTIVDVFNNTSTLISGGTFIPNSGILDLSSSGTGTTNATNIQNETIFLLLDLNHFSDIVYTSTENDSNIWLSIWDVHAANGPIRIQCSPLVLRYAWK